MKSLKALLVFLLCSLSVFGQKNLSISGTLIDNLTKEPVDFASVSLLNAKDSTFVTGAMSNSNGVFNLQKIDKGRYLIKITYIGYKTVYQSVRVTENNPITDVGKISLVSDDIVLAEAVVEGKAPEVVVKGDTIEYNADSFKTPQNAAVEELLKKLPGAEVDKDGNITVNGKEIKKILVDGKEFFSDDPKVASKNLPAEMVKKVQVLDRKSDLARLTGFDDGDEETVINLTIKEGMKKGTMGNAMAGLGHDTPKDGDYRYEAGAMVNHMSDNDRYTVMLGANNTNNMGAADLGAQRFSGMRGMRRGSGGINTSETFAGNMNKQFSPKLSLNGDISYNSYDKESHNKIETNYDEVTNKKTQELMKRKERTTSDNNDISDNFGINFRMEWKPDSATTIIFRPNFSYNKSNSTERKNFESFNTILPLGQDTLYNGYSTSFTEGEGFQTGGTLEYARKLSKPGRVFTFSVNGSYNTSYSSEDYFYLKNTHNNGVISKNTTQQQIENDNYSTRYGFFTSYVEPLGRNNFIQLSYRLNKNYSENINSTYSFNASDPNLNIWERVDSLSRSNVRDNLTQRINLAFKSVREKYNYTIGVNVDPSNSTNNTYIPHRDNLLSFPVAAYEDKRLQNTIGDTLVTQVLKNVVNFSPSLNFNYIFGKRTNLRIDNTGDMNQPTANQLSILDYSDPLNIIEGNPDLKPSYTNRFSARFSKFVPESQFFYNIDLRNNISFRDIVQVRTIDSIKHTTYKNVNGNWDVALRGMFNTPLRNKKFTVANFSSLSYRNLAGFTNGKENTTKNFTVSDKANINYRSELFDIGLNGGISYQNVDNKLQSQNNKNTYDWSAGTYTIWYLPHDFTIESNIDWQTRSGYDKGFNTSQTIWNATVSKQLFNSKAGAGILKLKIYDILQERKSLNYSVGSGYVRNTESTTLPSFFMCTFIYKFQVFPGGKASPADMEPNSGDGNMIRVGPRGRGGVYSH